MIDPNTSDTHSFTLSDDRFAVVGGEVRLRPGVSLDHEEAARINLEVTATDSGGLSVTESFEISVTDVNEAPESVTFDSQTIVAGQDGAIAGRLSATDPDAGDTLSFSVSDDRFEVVDGEVRLKPGNSVAPNEGTVELAVTATDSGGLNITESFEINVFDPPTVDIASGFTAEYFDVDVGLREISDIDWSGDPTHTEMTRDIDYQNGGGSFWEGGSTDTFGARVNGNIEVEQSGTFAFHLGGDDGAVLYVNGVPVIDNDGLHGYRTRTGEVELPEGNHHIEVRYFENYGNAGLRLEWEGPGIDGRQLVDAGGTSAAIGIEGMATPVTFEIGNVYQSAEFRLEGLSEGTVVHVAGNELTAGADGVLDLTGQDLSGLTLTPPIGSAGQFAPQLVIGQTEPGGEIIEMSYPVDINVTTAELSPNAVDLSGGFRASYFDVNHSLSRLDQINWDGTPTHEEIVFDVNYENGHGSFWEGGSNDTFGARIEGQIDVTQGGTYEFFLGGDDGAMLFINGNPVIDNDGLHGFRTRNGDIELEPGTYTIEVRYFENYGHAGLRLEWQGPDTNGRELVTASPDLGTEQNGSVHVGINISDADAVESAFINGMPAETILFLGGETLVSDGGPMDVTGHDLGLLEISPPAGFVGVIEGEISTTSRAFNGQLTNESTPIEMTVGDVPSARDASKQDESSVLMMETTQEQMDAPAWTEEDQTSEAGNAPDVLSEEIADIHVAENPQEQFDTYERYDW